MNKILLFGSLFLAAFLLVFCVGTNPNPETSFASLKDDRIAYVGVDVCKGCHQDVYQSYMQTGMGKSFGLANLEKSDARFDEHALVYDADLDYYYKPFFRDSVFYILEFRLNGKDTVHQRLERIDYIIGSGHHTNSHLLQRNGYLFQAPITYYTQQGKWDLAPGFEKGANSRFNRIIATECLTCHNHFPTHFPSSENKFEAIPLGIECERCHGPGEAHAREKLAGKKVDTSKFIDYSIVNPRHLPRERQMDLCQRCHLQGVTVLNPGKSFFDFKPGMALSSVMQVFLPRFSNSHERFIMASQADRLRLSPCYLNSKDLSCISCHNPHHDVHSKEKNRYNETCLSCHKPQDKQFCSSPIAERQKVGDNCVACHMPKTGSIDIPHVHITDHNIRKETARIPAKPISETEKKEIARFLGIECLTKKNPSHLEIAQGYLALYEKFMKEPYLLDSIDYYLRLSKAKDTEKVHTEIHYYFAKQNYSAILQLAQQNIFGIETDAWTCYRIGEAFYRTQQFAKALPYFEKAVAAKKHNLEFQEKLGVLYARLNQMSKARDVLSFVLSEDAARPVALTNLGYISALAADFERAAYYYDKALALDPDYDMAIINKAALYLQQNQKEKAKQLIAHLLKKQPNHGQANAIWSKIK